MKMGWLSAKAEMKKDEIIYRLDSIRQVLVEVGDENLSEYHSVIDNAQQFILESEQCLM